MAIKLKNASQPAFCHAKKLSFAGRVAQAWFLQPQSKPCLPL
jgi:hypothetical protein